MAARIIILVVLFLSACGSNSPDSQPWRGGLIGVWEPIGQPRGVFIVHQGHAPFSAPDYQPANLIPVVEQLRDAGFLVYGFEMPPGDHGPPIERFYQPVLDLIDTIPTEIPIYMTGLSGGGWTTTVVTSHSSRIVRGYSVAGDAPLDVWIGPRDWEQLQVDYRVLYAQAGTRLMHIYNFNDSCCFWGISGDIGYAYVTDPGIRQHAVTQWAIDFILSDIQS